MFLTVAHASLLHFLECMNLNVDQFLSRDPAEVTCDNTLTAWQFELYFLSVKVLKVQVKNKVHKVRTSQLCPRPTWANFAVSFGTCDRLQDKLLHHT